ncbi:MAG: 4-hydroxy-3-methylbut-2-enyl diphosphate reductase [Sumerlaeia bacterium]
MTTSATPKGEKTYYKSSLGLKKDVAPIVAAEYSSALVDAIRANGGVLDLPGLKLRLAKDFGFCYGVDKAVDMAYETLAKFPDRRIVLLTEIIHNPRVNRRMRELGIRFLSGQQADGLTIEDIVPEDVVLIPAFGAAHPLFQRLKDIGCVVVDTTCGSVIHVWKRVERYAREGYTSVVHGKAYHEETIATVSNATSNGGHFLVVRNMAQTERVCDFIEGRLPASDLMADFDPGAFSEGFDPEKHLRKIGVANQTTMLATESLAIGRRLAESIQRRDGEERGAENVRSFDTICSATQDRQDAMKALLRDNALDLALVVGGYNSSNTRHLLEVAEAHCPRAFHIDDVAEMHSDRAIRHQPSARHDQIVTSDWLPPRGTGGDMIVGITAGASTPNRAIGDVVARLLELTGYDKEKALEAVSSGRLD